LQAALHVPAWQMGCPLATAGQVLPQEPQFSGSLVVSTQAEPQVFPGAQSKPQTPAVHVAAPPGGAVQAAPQPPQFSGSLLSVTHEPPQIVSPCMQPPVPPVPPAPPVPLVALLPVLPVLPIPPSGSMSGVTQVLLPWSHT
jgi:hypothetical protein